MSIRPDMFTAVAQGDLDAVRALVDDDPLRLGQRRPLSDDGQTPAAFSCDGAPTAGSTRLWLHTDRVDDVYRAPRRRQLDVMGSDPGEVPGIRFLEDLYEPFYGGRQFSVADNNGVALIFYDRQA